MRRRYTRYLVLLAAVFLVAVCAGWAVLAQHATPDACSRPTPPPRAQYLHC